MEYTRMMKIINYTLIITIISIFTLVSVNNLSAEITKTINNKKYICKPAPEGKNLICKKAPTGTTAKKSTTHKNSATKQTQQKKSVAQTPVKKITPVKAPAKTTPKIAPVVPAQPKTPEKEKVSSKKSTNPLILVNRFEEDPTFLASITGILYRVNEGIKIIDVASSNESKDLIVQSYKLLKTSSMWGNDAVFISGSNKEKIEPTIIIAKSKNHQFFVTQDSGVLTFIKDTVGLAEVRKIKRVNFKSETLNGRDVEYLIGAQLIDNPANFDKMGEKIDINQLSKFNYAPLKSSQKDISSLFIVEDKDNGNLFTFIPSDQFNKFRPSDNDIFKITLFNGENVLLESEAIYKNSRTYRGGTEAIILDYKSSIGIYIAVKNIQNNELSVLPSNSKNYKIEITPISKGKPVDISNIENTDSNIPDLTSPLDEEVGGTIPYSQQRTTTSNIAIEEAVQNPKEANIKDLQKEKRSVDGEIKKQNEKSLTENEKSLTENEKSLTENETKNIYPSAGRNNLSLDTEVNIKKVEEDLDKNTLNTMIDEDLEN